jgi:hypothetical protein
MSQEGILFEGLKFLIFVSISEVHKHSTPAKRNQDPKHLRITSTLLRITHSNQVMAMGNETPVLCDAVGIKEFLQPTGPFVISFRKGNAVDSDPWQHFHKCASMILI